MSITYLNVSFAEKDAAKALGARWNPEMRKWYVPQGVDLAAFAAWLPQELAVQTDAPPAPQHNILAPDTNGTAEQSASYAVAEIQGVSLSQLMSRVQGLIASAFQQGVWTLVEVSRVNSSNGNVFLELSERNAKGDVLAQARGTIWAARAAQILPEFQRATGVEIAAGIKLLVRARPTANPRYGLSLDIDAINSDYTLGDLEAKKKQIRLRLQQEGIFTANKQLPAPWDFNHVLVIAPQGAAGLGDFQAEAQRLQQAGLCQFSYVHSRFQGEGAGLEISNALNKGVQQCHQADEQLDAVVIIRGGGAVNDLAWLNDYNLAKTICQLGIPVLTGIGHERDRTIADEVAHYSFDTPSKVIAGIEQQIAKRAQQARTNFQHIEAMAQRMVQTRRLQLEQNLTLVQQGARRMLADSRQHSSELINHLKLAALHQLQQARISSHNLMEQCRAQAQQQLNGAHAQVPALLSQIRSRAEAAIQQARTQSRQQLEQIRYEAKRQTSNARQQLPQLAREINTASQHQIANARQQIQIELGDILQLGKQASRHQRQLIEQHMTSISHETRRSIANARHNSTALFREIAGQGPEKTLERGFAIVRNEQGQAVTSAAEIQSEQPIQIQFKDGRIMATTTGEQA